MMRSPARTIGLYTVAAALTLWSTFPLYYAVVSSLSTDTQLYQPHYWPPGFDLGNYADVLRRGHILRALANSAIVASGAVSASLLIAVLAAFAVICLPFRNAARLLYLVLAMTMFPQVAVLAGFYELTRALGIYDTLWGVMLPYLLLLLPFAVWTLTAFMRAIPVELQDMAVIDGARPLQILTRIYLPLLWPGIAATGLIAFIAAWNEFLFAFTFTMREANRTVPVAISLLWGYTPHDTPWGDWMAACVMSTAPMILLVAVFQRRMASGLTAWLGG